MQLRDRGSISRRTALAMLGASAGAFALTACAPTTGTSPAQAPTTQPKKGGTLRFGSATDLQNLEVTTGLQSGKDILWNVTDPIIDLDPTFKYVGYLAESWEFSKDYLSLKLNLRKGVTFHSGREFGAEDVKYTLLRPLDPKNTLLASGRTVAQYWTGFEIPDKHTVIVKIDQPRAGLLDNFSFRMADRETLERGNPKEVGGTGPFKFVEWQPGQNVKLVRNPNWGAAGAGGRPYLDAVDVTIYPDPQAMVVALESGAVDAVTIPPLRDAKRLRDNPAFRFVDNAKEVSGQQYIYRLNTAKPPTNSKKVRQAIQYATDRRRMSDQVMSGFGTYAVLPWTPGTLAYSEEGNKAYSFSIDKARSLLKEAGAEGAPLLLHIASTYSEVRSFGEILATDLANAGFKIDTRFVTEPQILDGVAKKEYNVLINGGAGGNMDPSRSLSVAFGKTSLTQGETYKTYFYDDALAQLVDRTAVEVDDTKRKALFQQINAVLVEEANSLALVRRYPTWLTNTKVNGARYWPIERVRLEDVWLDK